MGDIKLKKSGEVHEVVVIGSGAGGGMTAYVLANAGVKVLMLEAGPFFDPANDKIYRNPNFYKTPEGIKQV